MHKIVSSVVLTALAGSLALAYPAHAAGAAKSSPQSAQAATVKEAPLRAHLAFLSSDAVEGRGTGQRGGELTVTYLETQSAPKFRGSAWPPATSATLLCCGSGRTPAILTSWRKLLPLAGFRPAASAWVSR